MEDAMIRNMEHMVKCEVMATGDIGGRLQRARQERGLTLHDAAGNTKLPITVIQAIERNDFETLPAGVYRKGYLRSLAGEVGLDPKEIAAAYDEAFASIAVPAVADNRNAMRGHEWIRELAPSPRRSVVVFVLLMALAMAWFA
jgi:cytoskeletal protein RodZ